MRNQRKRDAMAAALNTHNMVQVAFDATVPGADVPQRLKGNTTLVLEYGLNAATPIPDMNISGDAIVATLRFGTEFHKCVVPWDSVYLIRIKDENLSGWVFKESIPESVRIEIKKNKSILPKPRDNTPAARAKKLGLTVISGGKGEES